MEKNLQSLIFSFLILTVFVIDINQASQNNVKDTDLSNLSYQVLTWCANQPFYAAVIQGQG